MIATKFHSHTCNALALTLALGALSSAPAFAADAPFKATFKTISESIVEFPFANVHVVGDGKATYLGRTFTETTDQLVNLLTGEGTATYKFVGADDSELDVAFVFLAIPLPSEPGITLPGTWNVVGGSGRFANVSGSGTADGKVLFDSPTTGVGRFTMTGTLTFPATGQ